MSMEAAGPAADWYLSGYLMGVLVRSEFHDVASYAMAGGKLSLMRV